MIKKLSLLLLLVLPPVKVGAQAMSVEKLDSLQKEWIDIQTSKEYLLMNELSENFVLQLNDLVLDSIAAKDVIGFTLKNISRTKFANEDEVRQQYSNVIRAGIILQEKYSSFYSSLEHATPKEIKIIFGLRQ